MVSSTESRMIDHQSPFPRGKLGISLRAVSSKAPEQAKLGISFRAISSKRLNRLSSATPLDETLYATYGKRTKLGLGGYPTVSLQQARAKAAEARGYLNETPPRSPKEVWKERRKASNTPTFSEMSDVYLATMTNGWRSSSRRKKHSWECRALGCIVD